MVTEIGNYCYRVQDLEIKREPSSPVTKKVSIFPVSLNGVSQAISSLTPQRWIQFNFNVSFPFDLSEEDTSIVSGVPPSRNPWVPWVTAAFITPTPGHLLLIVTSGLITWNSCLFFLNRIQKSGSSEKLKAQPQPPKRGMQMPSYLLTVLPQGSLSLPTRAAFSICLN